ncbi:SPOR domain-containing protein [Acinetobacter sp. B5B]|uniref:SPOR domain-containing protein n=1 Tax=Acinetobacter baretiae TaxID=2605383 RepID=UPI0018C2F6CF|nr:SPOR domain-containing protein [Acinetobacter baretiae]MBF7682671.1 SPOR domain-containing protein [Acinetobacter baretiae]MBF7685655.1 SPOR domain-containing protein [Acinetobacter baretiae]
MFSKTQRCISDKPKYPKHTLLPAWIGTAVVFFILICIVVAFAFWKPWAPVSTQVIDVRQTAQETNHDYRFYEQLPKQQVTPIPEQAVPKSQVSTGSIIVSASQTASNPATVSDTATTAYFLQIKSFSDPDSADARRSEILMNKLPANVITLNEHGHTWYRVISGPYLTQQTALNAQQVLQNSGIDSIVVKN